MGINIKGMQVSNEKQVREIINTPQGSIEIYEPNFETVKTIVDMQFGQQFGAETGVISFDGATVIKELFPLLTNIELNDLTDEELEDVINNPSIHLLIAQQIVAQIVAESNKLYAQRVKTELMTADSTMAQVELINSIPNIILDKAKRDGNVSDLMSKVESASKELEEAIEKEAKEIIQSEEVNDVGQSETI